MPQIKILEGGGFVDHDVQSTTVGGLKTEKNIPAGAAVSVGGRTVGDDHALSDGDLVAAVHNDKTGGLYLTPLLNK
tara:strand:- start:541 stop:768 length:228 start_codon:yes stop_codon:yes gene_type:complete